jgi:hypothetical protein
MIFGKASHMVVMDAAVAAFNFMGKPKAERTPCDRSMSKIFASISWVNSISPL